MIRHTARMPVLIGVIVGLAITSTLVLRTTQAVFTGSTTSATNSWATGGAQITSNATSTAVFDTAGDWSDAHAADDRIAALAEDLPALPAPAAGREQLDALLAERRPDVVTIAGWRAIDALERERGRAAERPREKLASREDLLAAAGQGTLPG